MRHGAVAAEVEIPAVIFFAEFLAAHVVAELVEAFFALGAADDFADTRH